MKYLFILFDKCSVYLFLFFFFNRPFSLGGHVESQENNKLCFCAASLALDSRVGDASRAKTKLVILLRLNMAAE